MKRLSRIQQIYGYAVCLVAIIAMLISVPALFEAALARMDPIQAGEQRRPQEASLNSFEAFQATSSRDRAAPGVKQEGAPAGRDTMTTADLRRRYEVLRADRIARVTFETNQRLAVNALVLLMGLALFTTHWRWLRAAGSTDEPAPAA